MKFNFFANKTKENHQKWCKVYEKYSELVESNVDFDIEFSDPLKNKSDKSLRGYWRLCGLLTPCFQKSYGEIFDKEMVSDLVKLHCNYSVKTKTSVLPRSLKTISQEKINILIEKIYQMCEHFGLKNYELTSYEKQAMLEYFNKREV